MNPWLDLTSSKAQTHSYIAFDLGQACPNCKIQRNRRGRDRDRPAKPNPRLFIVHWYHYFSSKTLIKPALSLSLSLPIQKSHFQNLFVSKIFVFRGHTLTVTASPKFSDKTNKKMVGVSLFQLWSLAFFRVSLSFFYLWILSFAFLFFETLWILMSRISRVSLSLSLIWFLFIFGFRRIPLKISSRCSITLEFSLSISCPSTVSYHS